MHSVDIFLSLLVPRYFLFRLVPRHFPLAWLVSPCGSRSSDLGKRKAICFFFFLLSLERGLRHEKKEQ